MTPAVRPLRLATSDAGFDDALKARLQWSAEEQEAQLVEES